VFKIYSKRQTISLVCLHANRSHVYMDIYPACTS